MANDVDSHIGTVEFAPFAAGAVVGKTHPGVSVVTGFEHTRRTKGDTQSASFTRAPKNAYFTPGLAMLIRFGLLSCFDLCHTGMASACTLMARSAALENEPVNSIAKCKQDGSAKKHFRPIWMSYLLLVDAQWRRVNLYPKT